MKLLLFSISKLGCIFSGPTVLLPFSFSCIRFYFIRSYHSCFQVPVYNFMAFIDFGQWLYFSLLNTDLKIFAKTSAASYGNLVWSPKCLSRSETIFFILFFDCKYIKTCLLLVFNDVIIFISTFNLSSSSFSIYSYCLYRTICDSFVFGLLRKVFYAKPLSLLFRISLDEFHGICFPHFGQF